MVYIIEKVNKINGFRVNEIVNHHVNSDVNLKGKFFL